MINIIAMIVYFSNMELFKFTFPIQLGALVLQLHYMRKEMNKEIENE